MRHSELLHAIRAACDVADDDEVYIFGSQAILGNFPQAEQVAELSVSRELDLAPKNKIFRIDDIDALLGEGSMFGQSPAPKGAGL
jgi:hypothetical protein